MLVIDGSQGEGGGQVLRTSLALSLVTGRAVRLEHIRARRSRPGLRAQHLACVRAAAAVGRADVEGAEQGGQTLSFRPHGLHPGDYAFDVGTAGSTSLVLQTVLPALIRARAPSQVSIRGGTHNDLAPCFDFLVRCYLPLLERMGPRVAARLQRAGFYPKGGGRVQFRIEPAPRLAPLELCERGELRARRAIAIVAGLPEHVATRELTVISQELGWAPEEQEVRRLKRAWGPGNALLLELESEHLVEVIAAYGRKGLPAEKVARSAAAGARRYLAAGLPVGEHLADQLLLLLALAGGGRFRTLAPSGHTTTQIALIPRFLPVRIEANQVLHGVHELSVSPAR